MILVVEDDPFKLSQIESFLSSELSSKDYKCARSVNSARKRLSEDSYTLVILDMSLPTYDITANEPGGRPQNYGGKELLRYMYRKKLKIKTVLLTQYEEFIAEGVGDAMGEKYSDTFCGIIYFDTERNWEQKLMNMVAEA